MLAVRKSVLVAVASAVGITLVGCGPSKVAQCNKLIDVTNKATNELASLNQNKASNAAQATQQLDKMAGSLDKYATDMQGIELKDNKLQEYRTRFVTLYKDTATSSRQLVTAIQGKNPKAADGVLQKMDSGAKQEQTLVKEVNEYCGAK